MYYLSGYEHEGMLGVSDTEDNKEEFFPREVLVGSGQTIYGLNANLGVGTKFYNDYFDFEVEKRGIHATIREDLKFSTSLKLGLPPTIAGIKITSLACCFSDCRSLISLDLSSFDTRNVVDMREMFFNCRNLILLDLSSFDTRNVVDMNHMFSYCASLTSLNLSNFKTGNVEDMSGMFANCGNLISIDFAYFDTISCKDMSHMFAYCHSLTFIDLSNFNTEKVEDMWGMFYNCRSLIYLDLSSFTVDKVMDMWGMFSECSCVIFSSFIWGKISLTTLLVRNHDSKYETITVRKGTPKEVIVSKLLLTGISGIYNLKEV